MRQEAPPREAGGRTLVLGLGCERGTPARELLELADMVMASSGVHDTQVLAVATIDARAHEPAVMAVAGRLGVPLISFDAGRLEEETPRLAHPSDVVFAHTGCHGVAEAAALAAVGVTARLLVEKTKSAHATAAIAESFQMHVPFPSQIESMPSGSESTRKSC